ncbi:arylamine N-acetyltransferase [Streptomyces sp. SID3212]|uniref:arylamine N-acetyltransferase n=1 Tax=Streptomyces sp. SID3212 TaxID=2690259 RepID=UPI0013688F64|nr:arylamine N-acetyltransferase [Streptomyces sp. SID3212]
MADSLWQSDLLDLGAYLARTGYSGPLEPSLDTLRGLHAAHLESIPFENLDIVLGRGVPLDLPSLQAKLIASERGGYCYEHNLLFAAALEKIGFSVSGLGARVRMAAGLLRPVTHSLLRVDIEGIAWITDVGFGAACPLAPLPLRAGAPVERGGRTFELAHVGDPENEWILHGPSLDSDGKPIDLYGFNATPVFAVDFTVYNQYTSTHPRSPFTGRVVAQKPGVGRRLQLIGDELTTEEADGRHEKRRVPAEEVPSVLRTEFGIVLDAADAKRVVEFQRVAATGGR